MLENDNPEIVSLVVPVYNEQETVEIFLNEVNNVLGSYQKLEVVFVNDGSEDDTLSTLLTLAEICRRFPAYPVRGDPVVGAPNTGWIRSMSNLVFRLRSQGSLPLSSGLRGAWGCPRVQLAPARHAQSIPSG